MTNGLPARLTVLPLAQVQEPLDRFLCEPYRATITARGCVLRQGVAKGEGRTRDEYRLCVGCKDGALVAAATEGKIELAAPAPKPERQKCAPWLPNGEAPVVKPSKMKRGAVPPRFSGHCPAQVVAPAAPDRAPRPSDENWRKRPRGPNRCSRCRQTGHKAPNCPTLPPYSEVSNRTPATGEEAG